MASQAAVFSTHTGATGFRPDRAVLCGTSALARPALRRIPGCVKCMLYHYYYYCVVYIINMIIITIIIIITITIVNIMISMIIRVWPAWPCGEFRDSSHHSGAILDAPCIRIDGISNYIAIYIYIYI